jgi:hypothetical protein
MDKVQRKKIISMSATASFSSSLSFKISRRPIPVTARAKRKSAAARLLGLRV